MYAARISLADYHRSQDFIHEHRLDYTLGDAPPSLRRVIAQLGWEVVRRDDFAHLGLYALAARGRHCKIVHVNRYMHCAAWRSVYAHLLAHEALGTVPAVDELIPFSSFRQRRVPIDIDVERAAWAAQAMILVPEPFVQAPYSVEEIASYCQCTEAVAEFRLYVTTDHDDAHGIVRFDRRRSRRAWQHDEPTLYRVTSE